MSNPTLLAVRGLSVQFPRPDGAVRAVDDVSFEIKRGETVGLVGESGCGKSTLALALLKMTIPPGEIRSGVVEFESTDLLKLKENQIRPFRGAGIAYVPQETSEALNPVLKIGTQIVDVIRAHRDVGKAEAWQQAVEGLRRVGIPDPERRAKEYAHQFSGGMRQRTLLALALAAEPKLLVADEPTTAVDVTLQAGIIDLLRGLTEERQLSLLLVTHDLGVVAAICDRVLVMYAGRIVEAAPVDELFRAPLHPYTRGLLASLPRAEAKRGELPSIPGAVPDLARRPAGCPFHPRCTLAESGCSAAVPELVALDRERAVACPVVTR